MKSAAPLLLAGSLAIASFGASATITPTYATFGALSGATFGGSGIFNANVAIDTVAFAARRRRA